MLPVIGMGLRYCASTPAIRRILLRGLVVGFGIAGYQALVPAVVRDQLQGSEMDLGVLLGTFGVGSILAAFAVPAARRRWGTEAVLATATLAYVVAQFILAEAETLRGAVPATFIAGAGWVASLTTLNVAMQFRSPDAILGRCLSIYQAVTFGGMSLGAWIWGMAADWHGLPFALHAAGVFLLVTLLLLGYLAPMPKPGEGRVG